MKLSLFLSRLQQVVSSVLAIGFCVMSFFFKDYLGISNNPTTDMILIGIGIVITLVWSIVYSILDVHISSIKDEIAEEKMKDEDIKQIL